MAPDLTAVNQGYKSHVRVSQADEATFGTIPVTPDWADVPILGGSDGPDQKSNHVITPDNVSGWQGPRAIKNQEEMSGPLSCLLYPSLIETLCNWALARDGNGDLYSRTLQTRNPIEQRQYAGCMVNSLTIKGDQGGDVSLDFDLLAKTNDDASGSFAADPTYTTDVAFKYQDAGGAGGGSGIYVPDTTELLTPESFSIAINNKLVVGPYLGTDQQIVYCKSSRQEVGGTVVVSFNETTHIANMRSGGKSSLKIVLTHPTQNIDGVCTIEIDKMFLPENPFDKAVEGVVKETITFTAELPDSGDQIAVTITDKPGS